MSERIREDLEAQCRERLGRPRLHVTSVDPIPEGHSGFTYFVTIEDGDGPGRYVLRLPPPGARIAGPADVIRQGRIMAALHDAGLPTPAIPILTADPVVDAPPIATIQPVVRQPVRPALLPDDLDLVPRNAVMFATRFSFAS